MYSDTRRGDHGPYFCRYFYDFLYIKACARAHKHTHCRLNDFGRGEGWRMTLMSPCKFLKINGLTSCEIHTLDIIPAFNSPSLPQLHPISCNQRHCKLTQMAQMARLTCPAPLPLSVTGWACSTKADFHFKNCQTQQDHTLLGDKADRHFEKVGIWWKWVSRSWAKVN